MNDFLRTSDHRLAGVITKFNRSKEQFDELLAEMDTFFSGDPKPHFAVGEFDTEAWEWIERFQIRKEPPLRFGVMLGDVVHNLRSALDHLMWQVTLLDGGTPNRSTQFPIVVEGKDRFDELAARYIPGLSPDHRAAVESLQPYHAGDKASRQSLAVLNALSNIDKHQVVHATYSCTIDSHEETIDRFMEQVEQRPESLVRGIFIVAKGQTLHHGAPVIRIVFDRGKEPPGEVKVGYNMTLGVAFGDVGFVVDDMKLMAEDVLGIIQRFQAEFPETVFTDES